MWKQFSAAKHKKEPITNNNIKDINKFNIQQELYEKDITKEGK